jgi:hypothetical protein
VIFEVLYKSLGHPNLIVTMKIATAALLLLVFSLSTAKADFILKFMCETSGQTFETFEVTIKQTDTKQRTDFREYSVIQSSKTNEATILLHASRISIKLENLREMFTAMNILGGNSGTGGTVDFKQTGKTETIKGYETRELKGNFGGLPFSIFLTDNLPAETSSEKTMLTWLNSHAADAFQDLLAASEKLSGFPMRMVTEYLGTKYVLTYESLEEANLDDREFAVPNDYTELALSELFGH